MKYKNIKVLCFLLIIQFSQLSEAVLLKSDNQTLYKDIYEFEAKVKSRVLELNNEDFQLIEKYSKYIYEIKIYERLKQEHLRVLFKSLELALELNLINKSNLKQIRRMGVSSSGFRFTRRYKSALDTIYWWVEARNIDDQQALFDFLELQISKGNNAHIIRILMDLGQLENKSIWFEKSKIRMLSEKNEISKRQKAIIDCLEKKSKKTFKVISSSYQTSVSNIFHDFIKYSKLESQYLNWLLLQMNKNKDIPEISQMLIELHQNWLIYNPEIKSDYSSAPKFLDKIKEMEVYLNIKWKIKNILNISESTGNRK